MELDYRLRTDGVHCRTTSVEVKSDPRWHKVQTEWTKCIHSKYRDSVFTVVSCPTRLSSRREKCTKYNDVLQYTACTERCSAHNVHKMT